MSAKVLFVDRDGTLIREPDDFQVDCFSKFRMVPGAISALRRAVDAGYRLVMVSNQDGLGTPAFPREAFEGPQALLLDILASEGIHFDEILIDPTRPEENAPTRKPGTGLVKHWLRAGVLDGERSAVVGDRETDLQLAANMGLRGYRLGHGWDWPAIMHDLLDAPRRASFIRTTRETRISAEVDLDRPGTPQVCTGIGFFDHMLEQLGVHGGFTLRLACEGDLHVDEHHTVEDTGIALGQALREALADKRGIARYGFDEPGADAAAGAPRAGFTLPMDEALARAALDFGGRPYLVFRGGFRRERVGDMPTELVEHFFRSLCDAAALNLHLEVEGGNDHHKVEACFKAFARALRMAVRREGADLPSTKGVL